MNFVGPKSPTEVEAGPGAVVRKGGRTLVQQPAKYARVYFEVITAAETGAFEAVTADRSTALPATYPLCRLAARLCRNHAWHCRPQTVAMCTPEFATFYSANEHVPIPRGMRLFFFAAI